MNFLRRSKQYIQKIQRSLAIDNFVISIICTAIIALIFPASAVYAKPLESLVTIAIAILFFLYGLRIHPGEAINALKHWKLHSLIFSFTFIIFPVVGFLVYFLPHWFLNPSLYAGFLFLTLVPSTVQSSVAFTAIAKGNVPGAIVSASLSNIVGIVITPLLVILFSSAHILNVSGSISVNAHTILQVVIDLLVPFIIGQCCRPWLGNWVQKYNYLLKYFDRGSILLVVYSAFSEGQREHAWSSITLQALLSLIFLNFIIIFCMLIATKSLALSLGFSLEDAKTVQFCGTKKSLATGVPMAMVIFSHSPIGIIVLPLMLFHQLQLMMCSWLATNYAKKQSKLSKYIETAV